ncbi:MAG: TRAP transporter small permease [Gammaproteobacteria bacterium]|nr:TRAP transporter small permease [Gammaproteobacteria bacterium]MBT8056449.1 TRAP transporter small permease [Gammaproteobacteria bacterium]
MSRLSLWLNGLERAGKWGEDAVLVLMLVTMIALAAGQILLRNFMDVGFIWGDEMLRMLVLWLAVAGALAASREDKHISIDVLTRYLPGMMKVTAKLVVHAFTAVVCAVVAWHSFQFVQTSHEFGDVLLGNVPAWALQSVLPVGFGLIAWRYALFTLKDIASLFRSGDPA